MWKFLRISVTVSDRALVFLIVVAAVSMSLLDDTGRDWVAGWNVYPRLDADIIDASAGHRSGTATLSQVVEFPFTMIWVGAE